ncbi:MAG: type II secretion system protein [Bacilli bacterium]|nr:type II secretion system protein [Bacilli bacterium]
MKVLKMIRNRKKLDNKGFTLIELLAVIVILAIVMGLAANSVINSINNSRKSTLHSTAQGAANSLNTWVTEDSVVTDNNSKTLSDDFIKYTQEDNRGSWICLSNANLKVNFKGGKSLMTALGLSDKDIVISGVAPSLPEEGEYDIKENQNNAATNTCSAVRYNANIGSYEVFLVAKRNGKFYVSAEDQHFSFNRAAGTNEKITD